jgi:tyrosine aminotransferase
VPTPGFTLYKTFCDSKQIKVIEYPLMPQCDWEIDLDETRRLIESEAVNIKAWIVNNPSNPCGSVFSLQHLEAIKRLAFQYRIPIIADEVYEDMVFEGHRYHPMAAVEPLGCPVLTCSGLAKRFLVPGWRFGWLLFSPSCGSVLDQIRIGVADLACVLLGATSVVQSAVPMILDRVPVSFHVEVNSYLSRNAQILYSALLKSPLAGHGVTINRPQGSMYCLIGFERGFFDFEDDVAAARLLIGEESVKVLPGTVSFCPCSSV